VKTFFENFKELCQGRASLLINPQFRSGSSAVHVPPTSICAKEMKQARSVTLNERGLNFTNFFSLLYCQLNKIKKVHLH
jgi:hypothetical protein